MNRDDLEAFRLPPGPRRDTQPYGTPAINASPGCLAVALVDERHGKGHVEMRGGVPYWMPGPPRFPETATRESVVLRGEVD